MCSIFRKTWSNAKNAWLGKIQSLWQQIEDFLHLSTSITIVASTPPSVSQEFNTTLIGSAAPYTYIYLKGALLTNTYLNHTWTVLSGSHKNIITTYTSTTKYMRTTSEIVHPTFTARTSTKTRQPPRLYYDIRIHVLQLYPYLQLGTLFSKP